MDSRMLWSEARLNRLAIAIAAAIGISVAAACFLRLNLLISGDFPGFYAPAVIASRGMWTQLYDPSLQAEIENAAWPEFRGAYLMSVYPPYVAILLMPLGALSPSLSRTVFTFASLILYFLSFRLGFPSGWKRTSIFFLCFLPAFFGVAGGQNTSLSLLCAAIGLDALRRPGSTSREFLAGACFGLWFLKPQFAAPALVFLLLLRQFPFASGAMATAALFYFAASIPLGFHWPVEWIEAVRRFSPENYLSNAPAQVSLPGFISTLFPQSNLAFALALFAALILFVSPLFLVPRQKRFAAFLCLLPLISPQTLFYDLSISAFAALWVWGPLSPRDRLFLVGFLALVYALTLTRAALPCAPLFPVALVIASVGIYRSRTHA